MPGFITVNHEKGQNGRWLAPEGFYECIINSAKITQTGKGKDYLQIILGVRADVEQEGAGEVIDWPVWKRREPTKNDPGGFPAGTIHYLSRVAGILNGQNFETIDDWMRAITKKPIRVEIRQVVYNGDIRARVAYIYDSQARVPSLQSQGFIEVKDDDLPF